MPQRTNAFQRIVTLLNATLGGQASVVESAMLRDKVTQEDREVDVLITICAANYSVAIGVEVVSWSRPAGTPWVERMRAKHDNLQIDKLILVSQSGFTRPAIEKARFYGIETLTVERACATDWPLLATLESTGVHQQASCSRPGRQPRRLIALGYGRHEALLWPAVLRCVGFGWRGALQSLRCSV